jgi:hypothetical protein
MYKITMLTPCLLRQFHDFSVYLISGTRYEIWSFSKVTRRSLTKCQTKITTVNLLTCGPHRLKPLVGAPRRAADRPTP